MPRGLLRAALAPAGVRFLLIPVVMAALLLAGCSRPDTTAVPAATCDRLEPRTTYSADLDNDGGAELILVEDAGLTITDGDLVYQSREKWEIVDSWLGDVDHDGFVEVVTLLDDNEGRHIGLFAYFGREYRERIVTSELVPAPAALAVCNAQSPGEYGGVLPLDAEGDLIVLVGDETDGDSAQTVAVYRWNGFGFSRVPVTQP